MPSREDRSPVQHTAGPWKITQESVDPAWHIVTAPGGRIIANVHIEIGNSMDEANARLVVAALDMLKALLEIVQATDAYDESEAGDERCAKAIEQARDVLESILYPNGAIAKAEGES